MCTLIPVPLKRAPSTLCPMKNVVRVDLAGGVDLGYRVQALTKYCTMKFIVMVVAQVSMNMQNNTLYFLIL